MVMLTKSIQTKRDPEAPVEVAVTRSCWGLVRGESARQHLEVGERYTVTAEEARALTHAGAARYVRREDDHSDAKLFVLDQAEVARLDSIQRARKAAQAQAEEDAAYERARRRKLIADFGG